MHEEQFIAIKEVIDIIDEEVKHPLDLEQLAQKVGLSKYHLHRLFKSITNKSMMSYVRARRLSRSITELLEGDLNILDIAVEYQFEYEQSYIRAFKQQFNMTPARYRKIRCEVAIEQKIDTKHLCNVGQGLMLEPRMCIKPEFCLCGIREEVVHEENLVHKVTNKMVENFKEQFLPLIDNAVSKEIYYGLVIYTDHADYSNYYLPSIEVTSMKRAEPPFVNSRIPTLEYAVFRYIGFHSPFAITYATLKRLYERIAQWKIDTAYWQTELFHFERLDLKICSSTYCEMDIYVPMSAK